MALNSPQIVRRFPQAERDKAYQSAPYYPATNGAVERFVQVLKGRLKTTSGLSMQHQLANILLSYRSTPHKTTGVPPAELFLKSAEDATVVG